MRSDNVKKGVPTAPNRSLFYALGYTKEELERPTLAWCAPITRSSPDT